MIIWFQCDEQEAVASTTGSTDGHQALKQECTKANSEGRDHRMQAGQALCREKAQVTLTGAEALVQHYQRRRPGLAGTGSTWRCTPHSRRTGRRDHLLPRPAVVPLAGHTAAAELHMGCRRIAAGHYEVGGCRLRCSSLSVDGY